MVSHRTVITFEKMERYFYRLSDVDPVTRFCNDCGCDVSWLTPTQVVAVTGLSLRELFRRIEAGELHFNEMDLGLLHICPRSLGLQ